MKEMHRVVTGTARNPYLTGKKKKRKLRKTKKLANKKPPTYDQQGGY